MAIFDWFKKKSQQDTENPLMRTRQAPFSVDMTENIKINGELTRAILHNTYPGVKLAGALAYAPIMTPVSIMGIPIPETENEALKKLLDDFIQSNISKFDNVHSSSHCDGTIWVWPFYNAIKKSADIEIILDDKISDIIVDIYTGEIVEVISSEQITIQESYGKTKTATRIRSWKKDIITDSIDGINRMVKNPLGIIPIHFSNEPDIGRIRGHSDLERILPDLKAYHDVKYQWSVVLSKMKPFLKQSTSKVSEWLKNNGIGNLSDININNMDFVVNKFGEEDTAFVFPQGAGQEYEKFLTISFYAIVQGSSIPEIAWGLVSTGNHASSEEQIERLMSYCRKKQRQATGPWLKVFQALSAIFTTLNIMPPENNVTISWNRLDSLSESTKSEIFAKIADAISKMTSSGVPGEIIHSKLKEFYPESTIASYEEFRKSRQEAAKFKQFNDATYLDALDAEGQNGL
jgi:hypothetical protein